MTAEQLEHRKEWVAALRSGDYKQGSRRLRKDDNTFCCLGVLCDLYAKAEGVNWEYTEKDSCYALNDNPAYLPIEVQLWIGLHEPSPVVVSEGLGYNLTTLNDSYGISFGEIADMIEKQHIEGASVDA